MLGVLACCERGPGGSWQQPPVHVPPHARGLAASVQRAALWVQQRRSAAAASEAALQQHAAPQDSQPAAAAEQRDEEQGPHQQQQWRRLPPEPTPPGLQQLSGAARLTTRQAALGLAAARRQWLASRDSQVPVDSVEGGLWARQTARFSDLGEEVRPGVPGCASHSPCQRPAPVFCPLAASPGMHAWPRICQSACRWATAASPACLARQPPCLQPCDGEAARAVVEQLLARLPPKQRRLLLLRFGLEGGERCGEAVELDFVSLGRAVGVSRQRAQVAYRAALSAAQQEAAALGMA